MQDMSKLQEAFELLEFSREEQLQVIELVAACVHIGEIRFAERQGMDLSFVESMKGEPDSGSSVEPCRTRMCRWSATDECFAIG